MTVMPIAPSAAVHKTPSQLLEAQVQLLGEIKQSQKVEIDQLKQQNERLDRLVTTLLEQRSAAAEELASVKIEDVNMPFMALVSLIIKFALASIPAAIVIGIVWFIVVLVFGSALGVLRGALMP